MSVILQKIMTSISQYFSIFSSQISVATMVLAPARALTVSSFRQLSKTRQMRTQRTRYCAETTKFFLPLAVSAKNVKTQRTKMVFIHVQIHSMSLWKISMLNSNLVWNGFFNIVCAHQLSALRLSFSFARTSTRSPRRSKQQPVQWGTLDSLSCTRWTPLGATLPAFNWDNNITRMTIFKFFISNYLYCVCMCTELCL